MNRSWVDYLPHVLKSHLEGRGNLQSIISNTGWLFADRVIRLGVGLVVGLWVARYLGPDQFGLLSYVIVFVPLE